MNNPAITLRHSFSKIDELENYNMVCGHFVSAGSLFDDYLRSCRLSHSGG